ncbi:hypothetical protein ACJRPK_05820 [Aquimarina sp. 2-A2]|uniref:hypothetical protein n=1 Tax=Aquimarina sp. 2-A2 TaxID=3382644 RepID=UPI00387F30B4
MAEEITSLRIKAEKLGTVAEVTTLLYDLENAYNNIYAFNFIVDTLRYDRKRRFKQTDENFNRLRRYWKDFNYRKDYPFDPFMYEMFFEEFAFKRTKDSLPNLLELQQNIHINKIVLPSERLIISKVNIQSPGFWEVLGTFNPLQQIREYIKDRHERKKDNQYRSRQEEEIGELEIAERKNRILNQRIETLKSLGYSETQIRQFVVAMVIEPLNRLGKHQDNGQIEGTDEQ